MMQTLKFTLTTAAILFTMNIFARSISLPEDYEKLWKQVEQFNNDGLPQSALKVVEDIYNLAVSENNEKQMIKAIVHKMDYMNRLEEDGLIYSIMKLESEIANYGGIVKPFMHLLLATMYDEYFNRYSYLINQRSITSGFENNDIATWDKTKFQDKIIKNYFLSLNDILKNEDITDYSEFIEKVKESKTNFPTLYDFVAYHAINQLGGDTYYYSSLNNNNDKFKENTYLSDVEIFISIQILGDTLSYKTAALKMYQNWLKFRLENSKNTESLVNTDLMRLNFVKSNLITANKDKEWEKALIVLQKKYNINPELAQINWELAKYYNNLGDSYNFQDSTTFQYKMQKVKAMELLDEVITRFPDAKYTPACINLKNDIIAIRYSFEAESVVNANEKFPLRITYCNTNTVYMTILTCSYENFMNITKLQDYLRVISELLRTSDKVVDAKTITLTNTNDYNTSYTEYLTDALPYGFYVIILHANKEIKANSGYFTFTTLFSSDLHLIQKTTSKESSEIYVLNRKTGHPVERAKIDIFTSEYDYKQSQYVSKLKETIYTDKNGYAKVNPERENWNIYSSRVDISYKNDFLSVNNSSFGSYTDKESNNIEIKLFTDRAIYRPGQTVHFKGICIEKTGDEVSILPKYTTRVSFKDVNWQDIETLTLVANEYGSISGSFSIPLGVLTGNFIIQTSNGSIGIKVEEYKRPLFEVKTLPVEGEYRINDNVTIEGVATTYAGTALSDAKVSYSVVRNSIWRPWYGVRGAGYGVRGMPFFGNASSKEIAFGDIFLDDEGKFKIIFKAEVDEIELLKRYVVYNYSINISVTDINGETQTTSSSVLVSNRALEISSNIKSHIIKEQIDSILINTQNISGTFVPANVEIQVFKLKDNKPLVAKKPWERIDMPLYSKEEWYKQYPGYEYDNEADFSTFEIEKTVFQQKINTADIKKITFTGVEKWSSGVYRMVVKSLDKWGNPVENVQEFVLFSEKDKKTPYNATDFFYIDKTSAQPGETVTLYVGSSFKDVHLFYDLGVKEKLSKSETIKLSSEIKKIEIPIEESHRGNITVNLIFVKNGRTYQYSQTINIEWENKKLDIKFITFRDKTLPGANENWQLKISDHLSQPASAEFMASLYDASLDIFAKNSWDLILYPKYNFRLEWRGSSFKNTSNLATIHNGVLPVKIDYPNLILFNQFNSFSMPKRGSINSDLQLQYAAHGSTISRSALIDSENVTEYSTSNKGEMAVGGGGVQSSPPVQIRQNFAETAFFYPTLTTNEAGEIFLNFTMPESLTRWNFMGLAHTKDLKIGTITEEIVTQKELMVMPNLPRFFRENDQMTISAKINNVSEIDISGTATIEFFDVETLKSLNLKFLNLKSLNSTKVNEVGFNVAKDGNTVVEWQITIPEGLSAVGVRIIAEGKNHSDGEERILPVLTNKMLVTESLPLPVRKAGTKNFTFNSLANNKSNTLRHESFTLEFTANPAWYAVQALPYLMEYPYDCAEQVFSRFYANSLSSHIANSDTKIQRVFELWRTIPESKALLSNLEKNQELKALLIEETPWLLNAQNESERKRRIGLLFDLNRMANENSTAIKKLSEVQTSNGGFPWFKGMPESWYITQHIVGGFGHLDKLGVTEIRKNSTVWNLIKNAIPFLDKQLEKSYNDLKKLCNDDCLKKDNLGYMQIHYLYVRSFFINEIPIPEATSVAFNYYKNQSIQYWTKKDFYMQGMIALSLYRYGEPKIPAKIVASLKERAIHNDEMGTYWKYNSGCYWYQAPIETQALLIEVFTDVANDTKWVDEMKVWLLKQKQTQDWKTTKATTEAIYALLLQGTNLLAETDFPTITIGDMTIDPAADPEIRTEAGTGYFKKRWDGSLIDPNWGKVSVTKNANSVSWGAAYWQYFEQLDKIKQFEETPLTINKKLFVERREGDKIVIVPIDNNLPLASANGQPESIASLRVGDKVTVRIEIRTDRDMEYVHLKDMRAACFEPTDYISGYRYKSGLGYYQAIKDASMNFFIDYLRKGTYVFEYTLRVSQKGEFSNGITTIQSMYAPEFTSHSEGIRVNIEE